MRLRTLFSLIDTTYVCSGLIPRENIAENEKNVFHKNIQVEIRLSDIIEENGLTTVLISWYPFRELSKINFIFFSYFTNDIQCIKEVENLIERERFTEQQRQILRVLFCSLKNSINTRIEKQKSDLKFEKVKEDLINNKVSLHKKKVGKKSKTYIIYDKYSGCYKLGKSTDPEKRKGTLLSDRTSLELIAIADKDVETILHREYRIERADGEWFKLSKEQVYNIINKYNFKQVLL